ncbi:MAG: glycosyltransferase [Tepidisphaeraceae bacterium]
MSSPLVSVIIPCYRQARFLADAMSTVRDQSFGNVELVVVNDGSDDNTDQVMEREGTGAIYIKQANAGVSAARNAGAAASSGQYLMFLDADDLLHPQAIDWLMYEMAGRRDRLCVMGIRLFEVDPGLGEDRLLPRNTPPLPRLFFDNLAPPLAFLCSREMFKQVGGFETDRSVWSCEDWDLWLRMALRGCDLATSAHVGGFYRRYPGSVSTDLQRTEKATIRVLSRAIKQILNDPQLNQQWGPQVKKMRRRIGRAYFDVGYYFARQGSPISALGAYRRSIFCGFSPSANFKAMGKAFIHAARARLGYTPAPVSPTSAAGS